MEPSDQNKDSTPYKGILRNPQILPISLSVNGAFGMNRFYTVQSL